MSAQEADRRRIGKDRLLGEAERQINTDIIFARQENKPKGQRERRKEAWRAHPYQARKKKAYRPRGSSSKAKEGNCPPLSYTEPVKVFVTLFLVIVFG